MSRPPESAGELGYLAAAALLSDLAVRRATGQLAVWQGDTVKKVYCKNGNVVFATSNLPADRLGDVLLAQGMITPAQYEESASQVIATGRKQGTVLVQIGALTPKDLFRGLISQVREMVLSLFAWDAGGWRFSEGLPAQEEIVSLRLSASALVAEGLLRAAADPRFTARWQPERLEISLASAPPLPAEELDLPAAAGHLLAGIGAGLPWTAMASRTEISAPEAAALLYALELFGLVQTRRKPAEGAGATARPEAPAPPAAAPPAAEPAAQAPAPADDAGLEALRRKVQALAARINGLNFYQLLGLTPAADQESLKRAYIALAKEYHPDRFFRPPYDSLLEPAGAIFMRINEAYTTLANPSARATYDREVLRMSGPERPTQPDPDSRVAQEQFVKGLAQLKEGDLWSAIQAFRWAVNLSPQNPRYHTYLGVALTRTKKRLHEAEEHCKTAIALDYNNSQYYVHLGQVYRTGHLFEKARQQYEQALKFDPKHPQALRELQELGRESGGGGVAGKLLSRK